MAFGYYKTATLSEALSGTADSTDWPLTIALDGNVQAADVDLKTVGNGGYVQSSSGYDIRPYSDSALTTALTFELVYYQATTGKLEMHVKIPTLSTTTDTVIYLAFGDSGITTDGSSASTWDSNFKGVWHLPNGTTLTAVNSITAVAGTITTPTATSGQIDGGALFDGVDDVIDSDLTFAMPTTVTWEAWVYRTGSGTAPRVLSLSNQHFLREWTATDLAYFVSFSGGLAQWSVAAPAASSWHHVAVTHDASSASNDPVIYVNGASQSFTTDTNTSGTLITDSNNLKFGNRNDLARPWVGSLDEIRRSDAIRSASWITATYNAQKASSTFISWGARTVFSSSAIKTINGLVKASVKTVNGLAISSVKTVNGLA